LVIAQATLQADGNVECSAGGNGTSDTGHGDDGDIIHLDVSRRLGNKHQTLIEEVQKTLVCLDRTLDTVVTMVAENLLALGIDVAAGVTDLTKSLDGMMTFFPDNPRKTLVTTWWIGSS
jgi:hypothetical protein